MSLPAPAPAGLSVAFLRAGFARGLAVAAPAVRQWMGRAAPGEYRSPFPPRLRAARAAVVVLALLWLVAGFHALDATSAIVRTVGHDTAPSVSAAEAIRTGLAAANADFALSTLANEGADGAFLSAMRLRLRAIRTAVVEAAGNITYGDEERGPIRTVLQGLGDYEQTVGRSVASAGDARRDLAFAADDLLHWTVLPAAETLERVNADHLGEEYRAYGDGHVVVWAVAAAAALLLLLAAVQVDIARTAKRLVNPGLLLATLAVVAVTALLVLRLAAAGSDLRIAKADAFDSIDALTTARAIVAQADAAESYMLLAGTDTKLRDHYSTLFSEMAKRLLDTDPTTAARRSDRGQRVGGLIGDELANITFPGEEDAVRAVLKAWTQVLVADADLYKDESISRADLALSSKANHGPGSARSAFTAFDAAIFKAVDINRTAFAEAIARSEAASRHLTSLLFGGFLVVLAAAWLGIGRRLDEYRF